MIHFIYSVPCCMFKYISIALTFMYSQKKINEKKINDLSRGCEF